MSKVMFVIMFLFVVVMAFSNAEDLRVRDNLKPIAEDNCISEWKTFTGFGMNKNFYYCNGERRGFLISELNDAYEVYDE